MAIQNLSTHVFSGQRPGTSGLRKKVTVFMQPMYLENFVQALFDVLNGVATDGQVGTALHGQTLVLGGDGRFHNRAAVQTILKLAAANGVQRVLLGQVYARTQTLTRVALSDVPDIDIDTLGTCQMEQMQVDVIDPVADYAAVMRRLFDFDMLRGMFQKGFSMRVDAMNAVGGPYAKAILEGELGAPAGTVVNATPLEDFGGLHPDPNPVNAEELIAHMMRADAPDFGAAMDGDADRNMVLGRNFVVSPSDSLALMTAHARLIPGYKEGLLGVARRCALAISGTSCR